MDDATGVARTADEGDAGEVEVDLVEDGLDMLFSPFASDQLMEMYFAPWVPAWTTVVRIAERVVVGLDEAGGADHVDVQRGPQSPAP
ncbi:hypothetical protein [Streptomyces sp. NPDC002587]